MMTDIITVIQLCKGCYLVRLEKWGGRGQRVMIVIIIDENDDNSGWPLNYFC